MPTTTNKKKSKPKAVVTPTTKEQQFPIRNLLTCLVCFVLLLYLLLVLHKDEKAYSPFLFYFNLIIIVRLPIYVYQLLTKQEEEDEDEALSSIPTLSIILIAINFIFLISTHKTDDWYLPFFFHGIQEEKTFKGIVNNKKNATQVEQLKKKYNKRDPQDPNEEEDSNGKIFGNKSLLQIYNVIFAKPDDVCRDPSKPLQYNDRYEKQRTFLIEKDLFGLTYAILQKGYDGSIPKFNYEKFDCNEYLNREATGFIGEIEEKNSNLTVLLKKCKDKKSGSIKNNSNSIKFDSSNGFELYKIEDEERVVDGKPENNFILIDRKTNLETEMEFNPNEIIENSGFEGGKKLTKDELVDIVFGRSDQGVEKYLHAKNILRKNKNAKPITINFDNEKYELKVTIKRGGEVSEGTIQKTKQGLFDFFPTIVYDGTFLFEDSNGSDIDPQEGDSLDKMKSYFHSYKKNGDFVKNAKYNDIQSSTSYIGPFKHGKKSSDLTNFKVCGNKYEQPKNPGQDFKSLNFRVPNYFGSWSEDQPLGYGKGIKEDFIPVSSFDFYEQQIYSLICKDKNGTHNYDIAGLKLNDEK